ncbi:MAG: zeta toxin family protein [Thermoguttaceae bacterium]|jgi:predicted ABC-type ATPase
MNPNAYIIAGPNGAGKTTFAREFLPRYAHCREFLNADLLAAGLSPFDPDTAAVAAGRLLLTRMKEMVQQRRDFGFETTLAGKTYGPMLQKMRAAGYVLHLFYLWLPTVNLAISRVAHRVQQGGHNVPESAIRRRFDVGQRNLVRLYLPLFDSWQIFDNSTLQPRTIARFDGVECDVLDAELYARILQPAQGAHDE